MQLAKKKTSLAYCLLLIVYCLLSIAYWLLLDQPLIHFVDDVGYLNLLHALEMPKRTFIIPYFGTRPAIQWPYFHNIIR